MSDNTYTPLVSVVMPAYNAEQYIEEAIRSVQEQTMEKWELIVVDDCSTDNTIQLVQSIAKDDDRIRLLLNQINQGAAASRNRALNECRGQYVAFLDADDVWRPGKLNVQIEKAEAAHADIVYTSYALIDECGKRRYHDFIVKEQTSFREMLVRNEIGCLTVLIRRDFLQRYHFPEKIYQEDYALWLTLLKDGCKAVGVTDVLADYRVRAGSRSFNKVKNSKNRWKVYRDFLKMPIIPSVKVMVGYAINGLKKYR